MAGVSERHETHGKLEEHIRLIRRCIDRSVDDAATRQLANAIISGNYDSVRDPRTNQMVPVVPYYGRWYRAAPSWEDAAQLCYQRDYKCELRAIWSFVVMSCRYQQDTAGQDVYCTLRATLEAGGGDCDDLTIVFAALLKCIGFENIIARVVSVQGTTWDHIYPVVLVPGTNEWVALDCTEANKSMGWEYKNIAAKRDFAL